MLSICSKTGFDMLDEIIKTLNKSNRKYSKDIIYATEISNGETLQARLKRHDNYQQHIEPSDMLLGTIFDVGFKSFIAKTKDYVAPERTQRAFKDFIISGEADILKMKNNRITEVRDIKLSKMDALKDIRKDLFKHQYTLQLNIYAWLYDVEPECKLFLDFFVKDANKTKGETSYYEVEIPRIKIEPVIENFVEKYKIEMDNQSTTECSGTWGGTRCKYYCDVAYLCPKMKAINHGIEQFNF
jgi:hypothetical protein